MIRLPLERCSSRRHREPNQIANRLLLVAWLAVIGNVSMAQDFNGDGYADLAVGVSGEGLDGEDVPNAGVVDVIYGAPLATGTTVGGLDASGTYAPMPAQDFYLGGPADSNSGCFPIPGTYGSEENFGFALAWGRFNADPYADLAIGAPGDSESKGSVTIVFGSAVGLNCGCAPQFWTQDSPGIAEVADPGDRFGHSLAAGDFNADGLDDLAIGAPYESSPTTNQYGVVHVIYACPNSCGLCHGDDVVAPSNELLQQGVAGFPDAPQYFDHFGIALAAGPLNGTSGPDDLVISAPDEDFGAGITEDQGMVFAVYGTSAGLLPLIPVSVRAQSGGEGPEIGDHYGSALTIGNFDGVGPYDVAIGAAAENVGGAVNAGSVEVIYGPFGAPAGFNYWTQDSPSMDGVAEANSAFGQALAAGDFDGNGADDLLVGVPFLDVAAAGDDCGAAHAVYAAVGSGLNPSGPGCTPADELWHQDSSSVAGACVGDAALGSAEQFGAAVAVGDFDGNLVDDFVAGVPGEDQGTPTVTDAGLVNVIYGRSTCDEGLDSSIAVGDGVPNDEGIAQSTTGVPGSLELDNAFGSALAHP